MKLNINIIGRVSVKMVVFVKRIRRDLDHWIRLIKGMD